jgi:predicted HTH domain antitoxin
MTMTIDISPEIFSALRLSPEEFVREMRIAAAIHWYSRGEVSQTKAAEIAGMERVEFIDELARQKVDGFVVDSESLKRELERDQNEGSGKCPIFGSAKGLIVMADDFNTPLSDGG